MFKIAIMPSHFLYEIALDVMGWGSFLSFSEQVRKPEVQQ